MSKSDPANEAGYSLLFQLESDQFGTVTAELQSTLLDSTLFPDQRLQVEINTNLQSADDSSFVLESFHLDSLREFLALQPSIWSALERELPRDQERVDPGGASVREDVWSSVEINSLRLWDRQEVISIKSTPAGAARKSFFELALDCEWDPEHVVIASFCDGEFIDLDHT